MICGCWISKTEASRQPITDSKDDRRIKMRGLLSCFFVSDLRGSRMIQLFHGVCRSDLYGVASHPYPQPHHTYTPVLSSSPQTSSGCIHLGSFNMVAQHRGGQGSGSLIQVQDLFQYVSLPSRLCIHVWISFFVFVTCRTVCHIPYSLISFGRWLPFSTCM